MSPLRTALAALLVAATVSGGASGTGRNDGVWSLTSLRGAGELSDVAVSPRAAGTVYVSSFRRGIYKTTDGGRTWRLLGLKARRFYSVAVHPARPGTVYAGVMGGVSISRNAGASWIKRIRCCGVEALAFAFDPRDPEVVFAGGDGVSRSNDGGWTWIEMGRNTIGGSHVNAFAVGPRRPETMYAAVGGGGSSPTVAGVFKTADGGESWRRAGLAGLGIEALTVDPWRPWVIYATHGQGVYRSEDAGRTWRRASTVVRGCYVMALVADPVRPRTLYAGSFPGAPRKECGVFRSTDGARSWSEFNDGLNGRDVTELAASSDGRMLYAGTRSGRVAVVRQPLARL